MKGNELMDCIRDEMAGASNDYVTMLGELMTVYLQRHPETEIEEGKTLEGAFKHLHSVAAKKQKNRFYAMPPAEIFALLMEYYGQKPGESEYEACMAGAIGQTVPDSPTPAPAPKREAAPEADPFDLDALLAEVD